MLIMRYKIIKITNYNNSKNLENVKNKQNCEKCMFSCNSIYSLPREGFFLHISVATITTFPVTSLISSN